MSQSLLRPSKISILLVEDQEFLASMISEGLSRTGYRVTTKFSVSAAISALSEDPPNVVITDLNFGLGPTGLDLIDYLDCNFPWIAKIILSAHQSIELAVGRIAHKNLDIPYIVKSEVNSLEQIEEQINLSLTSEKQKKILKSSSEIVSITRSQAEILWLVGEGLSNVAIAEKRETSIRAVETILQRIYETLGIADNDEINQRVVAVRMMTQGNVNVK